MFVPTQHPYLFIYCKRQLGNEDHFKVPEPGPRYRQEAHIIPRSVIFLGEQFWEEWTE
jgi:hypothetical protein